MTGRKWIKQAGSALLELLIGGLVLGIAVIGVYSAIFQSQAALLGQGDDYVALYLAQQQIEQCIGTGFGTCTSLTETICYNCATAIPLGESGTQRFTRVTTVTHPDAATDQISVTVTPVLRTGDPITLVTVLTSH